MPSQKIFLAAASMAAVATVTDAHGVLTMPISRSLRIATNATDGRPFAGECPGGTACTWYNQKVIIPGKTTNCDKRMRTMGVTCGDTSPTDFPCTEGHAVPWCAPGTAPVYSPCGIFSGGWGSNGRDMRDIDSTPQATWKAGSVQEVAWAITANHGGGFAYRLCNADKNPGLEEECFQANHLEFVGDTQDILDATGKVASTIPAVRMNNGTFPAQSTWTRNPFPMEDGAIEPIVGLPNVYGRGPFNYSVVDKVQIPADLEAGHYVLSWRWDAEQTKQVWSQCSDVVITDSTHTDPKALVSKPKSDAALPSGRRHVCTGESIGLDVGDCDVWVDMYDAMGGENWPETWQAPCPGHNLRTDPCGCNGYWQKYVQCNAKRDYQRITEIYMLGENVAGTIPSTIGQLPLVALSLVGTKLTGTLPESVGENPNLQMLWLDHNSELGGPIPKSFEGLSGKLQAFELHTSNFTGTLPNVAWDQIPDCTLNGLVFDCPLPKGAETCGCTCK